MNTTSKPLSIIVAIAQNNAIGKNNDLLWHIPEDMKRFKKITSGHTVIMGKRTFESLPKRPLPNRRNIVITDIPSEVINGCVMAYSIEEAIQLADAENENFIIGGGSVYRQFMPFCQKLYITQVKKDFDADIFFPKIEEQEWKKIKTETPENSENLGFNYVYEIYEKIEK
jgi:dihydrofolate reductase